MPVSHISKSLFNVLINSLQINSLAKKWNPTSIFHGICLKPSQSRLLKLCGGDIHTSLIKGGWNVCVFFSFEELITPFRCDCEVPYMALCKNNVGNSFISPWRLLHCESCGCYLKGRFCFLNGMTLSPPCRLVQLQQVCRSYTENGLQFFSCCRKQWAQVTNILLCTWHCFLFLCWAAQQWADLNLWFSCEMSVCS